MLALLLNTTCGPPICPNFTSLHTFNKPDYYYFFFLVHIQCSDKTGSVVQFVCLSYCRIMVVNRCKHPLTIYTVSMIIDICSSVPCLCSVVSCTCCIDIISPDLNMYTTNTSTTPFSKLLSLWTHLCCKKLFYSVFPAGTILLCE